MRKKNESPKGHKNKFSGHNNAGHYNTGRSALWILLELAAVFLILTVAVNYIFNYIGNTVTSDETVGTWDYVYTNIKNAASVPDGEWETANALSPMSKEKTGSYLHLRGVLEGSDTERTLVVKTDCAPVTVAVNGDTVYNNHYGESEYVGNDYNAVVIPTASGGVTVEISMYLPFSAEIQTLVSDGTENVSFSISEGLVFSAVVLVLAAAAFLTAFVLLFAGKNKTVGFAVTALLLLYGAAVAATAFSSCSYILNFPRFYNIAVLLQYTVILMFSVSALSVLKIKDKGIIFCLILNFPAVAAVAVPQTVLGLKAVSLFAAGFSIFTMLVIIMKCKTLVIGRIQYAKGIFTMLSFLAMLNALCAVMQTILKYRTVFTYCRIVGEFVFLCFIVFILAGKAFFGRRSGGVRSKIKSCRECVVQMAELMKAVLAADSDTEICKIFAKGMYDIYCGISGETDPDDFAYSVCVKENAEYNEIYRRLIEGDVNYSVIEKRYADSENGCFPSETYFDLVFTGDGGRVMIIHIENIKEGLSSFFSSVIETLYSFTQVAFAYASDKDNIEIKEQEIFRKLAVKTEVSSGNNPDHLECVAYYTKIMLERMGYSGHICDTVSAAAVLHDIGKIAIPSEITNKTGLLSESEREIIKEHTEFGRILLSVFTGEFAEFAAVIAAEHHERYDGRGYAGIAGEKINEYARVVTVADTLDALTTKRSYKEAWPFEAVVDYIDNNSGMMYDPKVVSAMHSCIDEIKERVAEKNK